MAFRKMMTHHRKSKSIDWVSSYLVIPRANKPCFVLKTLCTHNNTQTSSKLVVDDPVGRVNSGSISASKVSNEQIISNTRVKSFV